MEYATAALTAASSYAASVPSALKVAVGVDQTEPAVVKPVSQQLRFPVVPGVRLWHFYLDMPLQAALDTLVSFKSKFRGVQFSYNEKNPMEHLLVLNLTEQGVKLRFDPLNQQLVEIEVSFENKAEFSYNSEIFSSNNQSPTFIHIYKVFGQTKLGTLDQENANYYFNYPGIKFVFPIPRDKFSYCIDRLPFELPGGTPVCTQMLIQPVQSIPRDYMSPYQFYMEVVEIKQAKGLFFHKRKEELQFGESTEHVISLLGSPNEVFSNRGNIIFNYFLLGIDVVFNHMTGVITEFVLHCNFPHHWDFGSYRRCNFLLQLSHKNTVHRFTPSSQWKNITDAAGPPPGPASIMNGPTGRWTFQPTQVFEYPRMSFEVMENDYIASVRIR